MLRHREIAADQLSAYPLPLRIIHGQLGIATMQRRCAYSPCLVLAAEEEVTTVLRAARF